MKWLHWLWIVLIPATALAVVLLLIAPEERTVWTTDSPEALEEFELCLEALRKIYVPEASRHCAAALEHDPDFLMPKLERARFLRMEGKEAASDELFTELREADLSKVTPRERFLIRINLKQQEGQGDYAEEILDEYLREYPSDPWAINIRCNQIWDEQEPEVAESCYERLLKADPNWVDAQNRLGYLAMARGRFEQAEEHFETYEYLAPDQANPHDSMGELLILIGRYEDAEKELQRALEIRPDFCASYDHLVRLYLMQDDFDRAREALAARKAEPACEQHRPPVHLIECAIDASELGERELWEEVWELVEGRCSDVLGELALVGHEAALRTGRREEALALEEKHRQAVAEASERPAQQRVISAMLAHMEGTRLMIEGKPAEAAKRFEETDRLIPYWQASGLSALKLKNQLDLAASLATAGQIEKAHQVLDRVRSVNPRVIEHYEGPDLGPMG